MRTRRIGQVEVGAIGLGALPMSLQEHPDETRSQATVHAALDAGVTLVDTADAYHWHLDQVGHNESVVARALATCPGDASQVLVATKGGLKRPPDGSWDWQTDGRPEHLRAACDASLSRLGVEAIGLYQLHAPDPAVPYAESLGVLRELHEAGKIRMAGISNAGPAQIRLAVDVLGDRLVSVQNQYSPGFRDSEPEISLCQELGLAFLPWSPLGGLWEEAAPRLGKLFDGFRDVGEQLGVSPQRVCLAWHLARSPAVVPIPGASRPETIADSARAAELELTPEQLDQLERSAVAPTP